MGGEGKGRKKSKRRGREGGPSQILKAFAAPDSAAAFVNTSD